MEFVVNRIIFDILFNGSKSKLLFFKGRFSNGMESEIMVNEEIVNISDKHYPRFRIS